MAGSIGLDLVTIPQAKALKITVNSGNQTTIVYGATKFVNVSGCVCFLNAAMYNSTLTINAIGKMGMNNMIFKRSAGNSGYIYILAPIYATAKVLLLVAPSSREIVDSIPSDATAYSFS